MGCYFGLGAKVGTEVHTYFSRIVLPHAPPLLFAFHCIFTWSCAERLSPSPSSAAPDSEHVPATGACNRACSGLPSGQQSPGTGTEFAGSGPSSAEACTRLDHVLRGVAVGELESPPPSCVCPSIPLWCATKAWMWVPSYWCLPTFTPAGTNTSTSLSST